ncbi:UNKNOWN [Stylonychia lemnae]|uniref:Transmembrane protein n=1 Tax=Stylonychia lemnae TaxID=5949 RepID=A0A078B381_STYLE|nr:UNKNOWN [Stylonychia lemnae]|eukprot:CDW87953.1 UNKNOWN [Stylonychia lemnae]
MLALRMNQYLQLGVWCLIYTFILMILSYFKKGTAAALPQKSSNGSASQNVVNSGYTTSYQQHSSSAEERKYMQQQLMQFNQQSRLYDEDQKDQSSSSNLRLREQNQESSSSDDNQINKQPVQSHQQDQQYQQSQVYEQNEKQNSRMQSSNTSSKIVNKSNGNSDFIAEKKKGKRQKNASNLKTSNQQNQNQQPGIEIQNKIKKQGQFQIVSVCINLKLHILSLICSVLNVAAQLILATELDTALSRNVNPQNQDFSDYVLCWMLVNSFNMIILVFAFVHQFIILPDFYSNKKQPEENIASGIYLLFIAMIVNILANLIVESSRSSLKMILLANSLIGLRFLIIKVYKNTLEIQQRGIRPSNHFISLLNLWGEFFIFILIWSVMNFSYLNDHPMIDDSSNKLKLFSIQDISDFGISFIYVLSIIAFNASLSKQTYYSFAAQYVMQPALVFGLMLFYYNFFSLRNMVMIVAFAISVAILRLLCNDCLVYMKKQYREKTHKTKIYGKRFQEDQYERLLPTPYASGVQDPNYNTDNSLSDPQIKGTQFKYLATRQINQIRSNFEYYIVENEVSLLLKKRACLDLHYKFNSIQHYSLKFYSVNSMDLSQSQDTNLYQDRQDEQRIFLKAIENYQRKLYQ